MFSFCCALLCVIFDRMSMMEEKENLRLLLFVFAYRDTHTHIYYILCEEFLQKGKSIKYLDPQQAQ